jgi:hypothetical protein
VWGLVSGWMRFVAFLFLVACGSATPSASPSTMALALRRAPARTIRVVPHLLVGVSFLGVEVAPHEAITGARAIEVRHPLMRNRPADEGDREWFFHGFDEVTLYFFVGRFHARCDGLGCQDYIIEKIYEVPRDSWAEHALGVDEEIATYERGQDGVHASTGADGSADYGPL